MIVIHRSFGDSSGNLIAKILLLLLGVVLSSSTLLADYQVGFATTDVTPSQELLDLGETYMAGYGLWTSRGAAASVHDPLEANAVCVSKENQGFCIVVVDSLGLTGPIIAQIAREVSEVTGLLADHVFVGATHTHAAPDLMGLWGGAPDSYRELLISRTVKAVVTAHDSVVAADLYYSLTKGDAYNRRAWGFTDDEIVAIEAVSKKTRKPIGMLINFAAHPVISTMENLAISSDYVHFVRAKIKSNTGKPVVFINGAIGDVVPVKERKGETWQQAKEYGETIAHHALTSLSNKKMISGEIKVARQPVELKVDNNILAFAQWVGILKDEMDGGLFDLTVVTTVASFSLGAEVEAIAVPGEASTRLGLAIKKDMQAPAKLFLGLSGGALGYMLPEDEWNSDRNNNYEESVSLGRNTAAKIQDAIKRLRE